MNGARLPVVPALGMCAALACGGASGPVAPAGEDAVLGPAGGSVTLLDGAVSVSAAPGALDGAVRFTAGPSAGHPGSHRLVPGTVLDVRAAPPTGAPVTVSLRLPPGALPAHLRPEELRLNVLDGGFWRAAAGAGPPAAGVAAAALALPATVALLGVPAASVEVRPAQVRLVVGASAALTATVRDAAGEELPARGVLWTTSKATVAVVDGAGVVTAVAPGIAHIGATAGDAAGSNSVVVEAGG